MSSQCRLTIKVNVVSVRLFLLLLSHSPALKSNMLALDAMQFSMDLIVENELRQTLQMEINSWSNFQAEVSLFLLEPSNSLGSY